ncbi:MAG: hypothetical protein GWN55_06870 [Phycisphaerae bacterium]|nr:hypothetical protein [Phycisphaerae bacterium]NIS52696.1 hypothetical protein [Phycisphaerae bacterium]NIV01032.1 hypothetical protein [Phycisphaerae bacterium]NIX01501.1 hypothetical protein [Phycisphaerae bacterium]
MNLLNELASLGVSDLHTALYATAGIIVLLALRMVKVSLDNATLRSRMNGRANRIRVLRRIGR